MKKRFLALLLSAALLLVGMPVGALAQEGAVDYGTPGVDYIEGEVIACVVGGADALNTQNLRTSSVGSVTELMDVSLTADGVSTYGLDESAGKKSLVLIQGDDTESMIETLSANPAVEYAEPNYIMTLSGVDPPSDPDLPYQWGIKNNETSGSSTGKDMNVTGAWNQASASTGDPVVAVLDSGVDYTHEDLTGIMWDDGKSIPALTALGGGQYGYNPGDGGERSSDPMDTTVGHGTHCAGIIAAQWNNGKGVAGVADNCQIMAVKMFADGPSGNLAVALKGYAYIQTAKQSGVNVVAINNSWGPSTYNGKSLHSLSTATTAIGELGVVSCYAAGNNGVNNDLNTKGFVESPYAIKVGAMDSEGNPTYFSCYGERSVDVFAPGAQILSTTSTHGDAVNMEMQPQYLPWIQEDSSDSYFYEDFEGDPNAITLALYDKDGNKVESAVQKPSDPGYVSDKGTQISLDSINNNDSFSVEIGFNKEKLKDYDSKKGLYLALMGAMGDACYGRSLGIQVKNAAGEWTDLLSANQYLKTPAMRLRFTDHNWNCSSNQILDPQALLSSVEGEDIVLRLTGTLTDKTEDATLRIDDFGIGSAASDYYYADGTSMATPMATGLVALLRGNNYNATETIARVKGGVDRSTATALGDKSVSGGFVDAGAAFTDAVVPVLDALTVSGDTATITGSFFGEDAGSVTIGGNAVTAATSWTANSITVSLPEGISGTQEVKVTRGDDAWGRKFLTIETEYTGYTDLAVPAFDYGETNGYKLTSSEGIPITMAGAGHTVLYLGYMPETGAHYMEAYDTESQAWRKVDLPSEKIIGYGLPYLYQMAGGKDKLYLLYSEGDASSSGVFIGTFDPQTNNWKSVKTALNGTETLAVYGDKLLVIGGDDSANAYQATKTVCILNPTNGEIEGSLPDLPEGRSGARAYTSGNTLVLVGGYSSAIGNLIKPTETTTYTNTMVYDGKTWTNNGDSYFSNAATNPNFDASQTLDFAIGAVDGGLIVTGPVKNLNTEGMQDTWNFDARTAALTGDTSQLYCTTKTTQNVGASLDGQFYALGFKDGVSGENIVFRSTAVSYTGPTGNPGEGSVTPAPGPDDNPSAPSNGSVVAAAAGVNTGITASSYAVPAAIILIAIAVLAVVGVVVYRKK